MPARRAVKAARHLAQNAIESKSGTEERIRFAYETVTSKLPDETELAVLSKLVEDLRENYSKNLVLANEICKGISIEKDEDKARVASFTMLVNALYNLDVSKTRE